MKKFRKLAASLCAAFVLLISFSTVAYAGGGEETEETAVTETAVETEAEANPFTPAGTGTVIDTATDEDGKEFYTIMTPDENVFYLIIDRQRETENVYFLNAVTENDLLALAEKSEETVSTIPNNTTPAVTEPEPEAETSTEPETTSGGGNGGIIVVVLIVLVAGGAGYYFKIYKPKQQQADGADEYDEYEANEDGDDYGEYGAEDTYSEDAEPEDDTQPWDEDGEA